MRDYRQDFPEESPSRIKKFLYNTKNQKTEIRLGDGQVQTKRYDAENLRCEMREGLLKEKCSSGKRLISYEYDNAGQMIRMTNPEGITVTYEYDSLGRKSRIYNSSGMEVRYKYD